MNCQQAETLLHSYLDDELDLVNALAVEEHIQTCTTCTQTYKKLLALHHSLSANSLAYKAPAPLQKRLKTAIRTADRPSPGWWPFVQQWHWAGLTAVAATCLLVVLVGIGFAHAWQQSTATNTMAQEVLASHVRSLMATHLTDVASSDQHTVKPWFDGKLDFAPAVEDLASAGFPLVGGRLDYLNNRPVAALVYQRRKHFINLFIWPADNAYKTPQSFTRQGYHLYQWQQANMVYWAVSDVTPEDLQAFVQLLQKAIPPSANPS